ncbi:S9 family peptidase [Actinomadura sp. SCN-SB]|uniref:S9 family peptidase n=1 Tax=Actinomadura sp. SCN-SB TaxID=3373092 RepID=UPI0037514A5C
MPEFQDFVPQERLRPVLALSPDGRMVAYSSNAHGSYDLWVTPVAGGGARRLTRLVDRGVREIAWAPDGKSLVFTADREGDEQYRVYQVGVDGEEPAPLSRGPECQRVLAAVPFDLTGRLLVYAANDRDRTVQDVLVHDLADGSERRIVPPEGVVFEAIAVSPDGRWLTISGRSSNTDVAAYLADLTEPRVEPVCVTAGLDGRFFEAGPWDPDSTGFYLRTDLWGEFTAGARYDLTTKTLSSAARHDWDVEYIEAAGDVLVWSVNQDGRSTLYGRRRDVPLALAEIPAGVVSVLKLAADARHAVMLLSTASRPTEVAVLELSDDHVGRFRYLTDTRPPALRVIEPVQPEPVAYRSSRGRDVHALLYQPNDGGSGPRPVLLSIHGGPEAQERPGYAYAGLYQYLLAHGIAILAPNIAGSVGYGLTHQRLIYRDWAGVDLEDLDHAVQYLIAHPGVDARRIAVWGASYGGFAALSCLARLPYDWAAGISLCGPTNLVTLASACPPTWKVFVANVLGDPGTDADELTRRSPITRADDITAPLMVIQGANDPRVPRSESDQLVDLLRNRGVQVRYDVYPNEGHGFANRRNEIRAYQDMAEFLIAHLTKPSS